jgi:putative Ca2+/H+ antiporter (TMEM165/GDT1 family)
MARLGATLTLQRNFLGMAFFCLALVPIASVLAAVILFSTAFLPFILGSEFAPSFSPQATVHLDIVILILIASMVIGYSVSFLLNPSTPILATVCNHVFGDSAIRKPLEDSMVRLRKAQRSQLNVYASAMLVCAAFVATVMSPAGPHQQLTAVSRSRFLNLDDAPTQPVTSSDADNAGHHWLGMGKALLLIFLAEIGDKTFFVAMILAMKYDQSAVFVGSMAALALMTILSAGLGYVLVGLVKPPPSSAPLSMHHIGAHRFQTAACRGRSAPTGLRWGTTSPRTSPPTTPHTNTSTSPSATPTSLSRTIE